MNLWLNVFTDVIDQWQPNLGERIQANVSSSERVSSFIWLSHPITKWGYHSFLGTLSFKLLSNKGFGAWRLPDMCQLYQHVPVPFYVSKYGQERGHLVLRNRGRIVYCDKLARQGSMWLSDFITGADRAMCSPLACDRASLDQLRNWGVTGDARDSSPHDHSQLSERGRSRAKETERTRRQTLHQVCNSHHKSQISVNCHMIG